MTTEQQEPFDFERASKVLTPKALAELATLHGMDSEEARSVVQQWPLGTRTAMQYVGLIDQQDVGEPRLQVSLTSHFEEAARLAAATSPTE